MSAADPLRSDRLRAALGSVTIGREILVLEEVGSTNDVVAEMAKNDRPEGLVVFAEHQTAGRGQRGNAWASSACHGLWFSILLRPRIAVADSASLTTWAAETVASTVTASCMVKATVKPPNDVYLDRKKVAGILVEMRAQSNAPHLAILGIGLNVNQALADFPTELQDRATSLALVTNRQHDRNTLAISLLRNLDQTYRDVVSLKSMRRS
jgi:BirA family biotin operon repressor/biotin-[acetyl-CoA-carboxylase] ligase